MVRLEKIKERCAKKVAEYELITHLATNTEKQTIYKTRAAKLQAALQKITRKVKSKK
jgi:hypothetical protein